MTRKVGVWVDRSRSFIVTLSSSHIETTVIASDMQKNVRFMGGAFKETEEDIRDRKIRNQFNIYLDKVTLKLQDVTHLFIMGPGNAKLELQKHLLKARYRGRIIAIETAGKMTERQIIAKVSGRFSLLERPLRAKPAAV